MSEAGNASAENEPSSRVWVSACPHVEAVGTRWGDPISEERQAELKDLADQQQGWAARREQGDSDIQAVELTGADVFWLAAYALAGQEGDAAAAQEEVRAASQEHIPLDLSTLHLEEMHLFGAHLERAYLVGVHLEHARLDGAHLAGALLNGAQLSTAHFNRADLEKASLIHAGLERAILGRAHLEGADLRAAHLEGASLYKAYLAGTNLNEAHLEGRRLGADELQRLRRWQSDVPEVLPPADLRGASLSPATNLEGVIIGSKEGGFVRMADVRWGGVDLAVVKWAQQEAHRQRVRAVMLGDESQARQSTSGSATWRLEEFEAAVRANRQLATALRAQGLDEDADHFAYRAQVLQREVLRRQGQPLHALVSGVLDALAGYGYRPQRTLVAYLIAILGFGTAYFFLGRTVGPRLSPLGSLVFSMTSFHGRGFFSGGVQLDDPITVLAALEALIGLVIEVTFIATLTRRFVGTK
jgi:uncharacterized protein YjbI with pentapeptide repeats